MGVLSTLRYEGWQGRAKGGDFVGRRRERCVDHGAAEGGFGELGEKRLEFRGNHQDTLGLQRTADSRDRCLEVVFQKSVRFVVIRSRFDRTFKERGEDEAALLEVAKDFLGRLPFRRDAESRKENIGLTGEAGIGSVEKLGISFRGRGSEEKCLDVDWAETGGPFKALQAASDVLGRSELAAAIAGQKCGDSHIQKW